MGLRDVEGLAEHLGMSKSWVKQKVAAREIPFHRFGRNVRFTDADVAAIEAAAAQPADNPYSKVS